jgi:hypothetical protein
MILVHFAGDGPRDAATVPHLVRGLVGDRFRVEAFDWHHLRVSGYARKLKFLIRQAIDAGASALVATLDSDHLKGRLAELRAVRSSDPSAGRLPIVLAEAVPHGEAWLLDDEAAVRETLRLDGKTRVPPPASVESPKEAIHALISASPRAEERVLELLSEIASCVQEHRCARAKQTGFDDLAKASKSRLAPLL